VDIWTSIGIRAGEAVNDVSLRIGEYEALKEVAIDPYVVLRNAYVRNRNKLVAEYVSDLHFLCETALYAENSNWLPKESSCLKIAYLFFSQACAV
jgi:ABC-type transporter lipoprotein component MlaA